MSARHVVEIPPAALAAVRAYAELRHYTRIDGLVSSDKTLSQADRETLQDALRWWQRQHDLAGEQVRAIVARLARA
jgi:hypothetical protein